MVGQAVPGRGWDGYYAVKSPDDEFVMFLGLSDDVSGVRMGTKRWVLPAGLGAHLGVPVYRFAAKPSAADLAAFLGRCDAVIAEFLKEASDLPALADVEMPVVDDKVPAAPSGALKPGGFAAMDFKDHEWAVVLGSEEPGVIYDKDAVKGVAPVSSLGDFCLFNGKDGVSVLRKTKIGEVEKMLADAARALRAVDKGDTPRATAVDDARILAIQRNTVGKRYMGFAETVRRMKREDFPDDDWILMGPRSVPYCFNEYARTGVGAVARSATWRHENSVDENSHNGSTHELLSEAIELFVCVDQVDGFNSTGLESLMRSVQHIEYEVKKKREAKAPPDGGHYFRARVKQTGGAVIDPALLKWISECASRDSAILKEQRKAAEEFALARKKKPTDV